MAYHSFSVLNVKALVGVLYACNLQRFVSSSNNVTLTVLLPRSSLWLKYTVTSGMEKLPAIMRAPTCVDSVDSADSVLIVCRYCVDSG